MKQPAHIILIAIILLLAFGAGDTPLCAQNPAKTPPAGRKAPARKNTSTSRKKADSTERRRVLDSTARADSIAAATARQQTDSLRRDSLATATTDSLRTDSLGADSIAVTTGRSGVDTVVTGVARSRIVVDLKARQIHLYRKAELDKPPQKLAADYIRLDFNRSEIYATAAFDSVTKKYSDVPLLRDGTQELTANTLTYNFKTRRGTLGAAETKLGDGFYYGERIKQVAANTYFVKDGRYTTCDAPHPHYYFSSPRMKVITGDRVFADQVVLNVADVPVFMIPFGVFFPSKTGRQSGLIIPSFSQTAARGFTLDGLGFFWDINEYADTRLSADLYSKGGFTLRNYNRVRVRGLVEQLDVNLTYGRIRDDPDSNFTTSYIADIHIQAPIGRRGRLGGTLYFSSVNALRNTNPQPLQEFAGNDFTRTSVTSDLSYSTDWSWGGQFSAGYRRDQSVLTRDLTERVPLTFRFPTITPFASSGVGAFENLSMGLSIDGTAERERRDTLPDGSFRVDDTRAAIVYRPSISISPRFGYINVSPFIGYTGSIFFRRLSKQADGDTIATTMIPGFYHAYSYNMGLSLSTSLYGIVQPKVFGINAIRHTLSPSVSFTYTPDFGRAEFGYYDDFFNPITNAVERYSIFERDATVGTYPGIGLQQSIGISLRNEFEAKIAQGDTLEDRKVRLLSLTLSTSYNAAAEEFRWSVISASAHTSLGDVGEVSGNATFDLYDVDSIGRRIPELKIDRGNGLVRVLGGGLTFSTRFSDQGFTSGRGQRSAPDSSASRRERFNFDHVEFDEREFHGEEVAGDSEFRMPWEIGLSGSYSLVRSGLNDFDPIFSINTDFSFSLTPTTRVRSSASYSFDQGRFLIPTITLVKDLHCWEMNFTLTPTGYGRGFYFRVGLKAPQLQDVKYERRQYYYE